MQIYLLFLFAFFSLISGHFVTVTLGDSSYSHGDKVEFPPSVESSVPHSSQEDVASLKSSDKEILLPAEIQVDNDSKVLNGREISKTNSTSSNQHQEYHHPGDQSTRNTYPKESDMSTAEICTPSFQTSCTPVKVVVQKISDEEKCVNITHRICSETPAEIEHEICVNTYQSKPEKMMATSYKVTMAQQCHRQEEQDICYSVPTAVPVEEPVTMAHPQPVRTCLQKTVSIPHITCEDIVEVTCLMVPQIMEDTLNVEKCGVSLGSPSCQLMDLTLPNTVFGNQEDTANMQMEGSVEDKKKIVIPDKPRLIAMDTKILAESEVIKKKSGVINRKINTKQPAPSENVRELLTNPASPSNDGKKINFGFQFPNRIIAPNNSINYSSFTSSSFKTPVNFSPSPVYNPYLQPLPQFHLAPLRYLHDPVLVDLINQTDIEQPPPIIRGMPSETDRMSSKMEMERMARGMNTQSHGMFDEIESGMSDKMEIGKSEDINVGMSDGMSGVMTRGMSDGMSGVMTRGMSDGMSAVIARGVSDGMSGVMTRGMSDGMSAVIARGMSDGMSGVIARVMSDPMGDIERGMPVYGNISTITPSRMVKNIQMQSQSIRDGNMQSQTFRDKSMLSKNIKGKNMHSQNLRNKNMQMKSQSIRDKNMQMQSQSIRDGKMRSQTFRDKSMLSKNIRDKNMHSQNLSMLSKNMQMQSQIIKDNNMQAQTIRDKNMQSHNIIDNNMSKNMQMQSQIIKDNNMQAHSIRDKNMQSQTITDKKNQSHYIRDKNMQLERIRTKNIQSQSIRDKNMQLKTNRVSYDRKEEHVPAKP